jgi:predicted RND superfamily exporter protein
MTTPPPEALEGPRRLANILFAHRRFVVALFALITLLMALPAASLRVDAAFGKLLPQHHPYMATYRTYAPLFGGGNQLLVGIEATHGDIFTPAYFDTLQKVTDAIFFLPGIDRSHVSSLTTPDVRYIEVVEDGFRGGQVVPSFFQPTPEGFAQVRANIGKSHVIGRLVAPDMRAAIVSARLLDTDPVTHAKVDYIALGNRLEALRAQFDGRDIKIHIIGFCKAVADIADGARNVAMFFGIAILISVLLLYRVSHNIWLTLLPVFCSLAAVVWQAGVVSMLGMGIDPISMLIPFLVFSIGISHGIQMVLSTNQLAANGATGLHAARESFCVLARPGFVALATAATTFLTITIIDIPAIRQLAITALAGIFALLFTNLVWLPLLISFATPHPERLARATRGHAARDRLWRMLAVLVQPRKAAIVCAAAALLTLISLGVASRLVVGDLAAGVPELRPDSRYNHDAMFFAREFSVGVDQLQIIAAGQSNACVDPTSIRQIDDFANAMRHAPGVASVQALPMLMKEANVGWNEGNLRWHVLSRNPAVLAHSATVVGSDRVMNSDCSAMPVILFLTDHRATTIDSVIASARDEIARIGSTRVNFLLASSNIGTMAATNDVVRAAQLPMMLSVYGLMFLICLVTFRSLVATICIIVPLAIVSLFANATMAALGIGLKISTLPVAALGVGIGVDYGIYKFSRLRRYLLAGMTMEQAYLHTLRETGTAVIFTGLALSLGVVTWVFSPLAFQADMGLLLTVMFLMNMVGATLLLPAIIGLLRVVWPGIMSEEVNARPSFLQKRSKKLLSG